MYILITRASTQLTGKVCRFSVNLNKVPIPTVNEMQIFVMTTQSRDKSKQSIEKLHKVRGWIAG